MLRLGALCAAIVVIGLSSTGVMANPEDEHPEDTQGAPGCGGMPMPEISVWAGTATLLGCCAYAALRRKRNAS